MATCNNNNNKKTSMYTYSTHSFSAHSAPPHIHVYTWHIFLAVAATVFRAVLEPCQYPFIFLPIIFVCTQEGLFQYLKLILKFWNGNLESVLLLSLLSALCLGSHYAIVRRGHQQECIVLWRCLARQKSASFFCMYCCIAKTSVRAVPWTEECVVIQKAGHRYLITQW